MFTLMAIITLIAITLWIYCAIKTVKNKITYDEKIRTLNKHAEEIQRRIEEHNELAEKVKAELERIYKNTNKRIKAAKEIKNIPLE